MIVVAGTITFDPANHNPMIEAAQQVAEITRSEEGCISYEFFADLAERGRLLVFEEWESEAHLEDHMVSSHLADFYQVMKASDLRDRSITRYIVASHGPNRPGG